MIGQFLVGAFCGCGAFVNFRVRKYDLAAAWVALLVLFVFRMTSGAT